MKYLLLILIGLACVTASSNPIPACQCDQYGTPVCAVYWQSDAVFVGLLRDITPPDPKSTDGLPTATLHFIVEQPFRGITTTTVDVETLSGTSCDMPFSKGKRYLIYADRDSDSKQLFAGPCSRTRELENADDDLNYIRSLTQQGVTESIGGRLVSMRYDSIAGAKIEVRNESKSLETTTNEEGRFSVSLAGPGIYTVKVRIPYSMEVGGRRDVPISDYKVTDALTTFEYKVEVRKNECDYRQFDLFRVDLHATAEISGHVLTASGQPVNKGFVHLFKDGEDYRLTEIEVNGTFKFEAVAVGEYFLILNPRNEAPDANDPPYPRTFYPNAPDESGATKIVVTKGANLENLTLRVGPAWKARTVSGRVTWSDGSPVRNAHVSLYDGDRYVRMSELDDKGRFSFQVYGEFNYAIKAQAWRERRGESERIAITNKTTNLKLVLKPK